MKATITIPEKRFDALLSRFGHELTHPVMVTKQRATIYLLARENGTSPRMALMLAVQQAPEERTADQWHRGNKHFSKELGEKHADRIRKLVARHGVTMGPHDDYLPWMAKYPGDPDAVVSGHQGPREQIQRAAAKLADHERRKAEQPRVALREDLVQEELEKVYEAHPDMRRASQKEKQRLRREIIQKHAFRPEEAGAVGV